MRATSVTCFHVALILFAAASATAKEKPSTEVTALTVGEGYVLRVERNGTRKQYSGELVKLTDRWIVLRSLTSVRGGNSTFSLISGMFHSGPKEVWDEHLWIPREAATAIEKRYQPPKAAVTQVPPMNSPPVKVSGALDLVVHDKAVQRAGGIQSVTDQHVTLAIATKIGYEPASSLAGGIMSSKSNKPKSRFTREQYARSDLMCIHVANFDIALREAMSRQ